MAGMACPGSHSDFLHLDFVDVLEGLLFANDRDLGSPGLQTARAADPVETRYADLAPESRRKCWLEELTLFWNQLHEPTWRGYQSSNNNQLTVRIFLTKKAH